ncbi:MAG TPA: hypothetical protein VFX98_04895, partial [Longimicrobiaceae bacterium]|nr:hypothetical protein [Longimicrobiaceae bacterium]
ALFPQREHDESAADFFLRVSRWRREHGIPETCYIRINPGQEPAPQRPGQPAPPPGEEAPPPEPELPGYDAPAAAAEEHEGEAAEEPPAAEGAAPAEGEAPPDEGERRPAPPRTQPSRDLYKPQFMDFANPLLVGLLGKMAANLKAYTATIEERLPRREALPLHQGEAYATELVVQLNFPGGVATAPAARAEEGHATLA